jgi:hypothetical protein
MTTLLRSHPLDQNQYRIDISTAGKSRLQKDKEEILPFRTLTHDTFWDRIKAPLMAMETNQPHPIRSAHHSMMATSHNMPLKADQTTPHPQEHSRLASQGDNTRLWNQISTQLQTAPEVFKVTFPTGSQWDVTWHLGILGRRSLEGIIINHLQNHWVLFLHP